MSEKKVLFAVGGTGGHIFPAVALAEELTEHYNCKVMFAGGKLGTNLFFDREQFSYEEVPCAPFSKNPWTFFKAIAALIQGISSSIKLIHQFQPDCVVGFGSYYTLPVLIASKLTRKSIFLHEQNSIPGRVNRLLSPFVEKTWVHFAATQKLVRGKSEVGGLPLRKGLKKGVMTKQEARKIFNLDLDTMTFLVFGGSQGAERLNSLFSEAALFHLKDVLPTFQVIHFTGPFDSPEKIEDRYATAGIKAYVRPFEKRMEIAWSAADYAITRAGAASIAEQVEFEVPGILIPYPHSTDGHQDKNADFLVEMQLGIKVIEAGLTPVTLTARIKDLILSHNERLIAFLILKAEQKKSSLANSMSFWMEEQLKR